MNDEKNLSINAVGGEDWTELMNVVRKSYNSSRKDVRITPR